MKHSPGFLKLVDDAKERIKQADFRDIKRRMDGRGKGIIERDIEEAFPDKQAALVLYCGGGFRSALVADNLQKMGYTNVISMDGGWRDWTGAGYPVEKPGETATE
jgi:rhodanese-related sulfurtransferase